MNFVEKNEDLLQNIEFAAIKAAKENPKIADQHIYEAYCHLKKLYTGKIRGWKSLPTELSDPDAAKVSSAILNILKIRTGEIKVFDEIEHQLPPLDSKVALDCFDKLISSVKKWSRGDKRSHRYIDFVSPFFP